MNRTCQASLSITNSQNLLKLMSIELVMPSNYLILCHPLLLLPPTPPSIRVFSNESNLHMRWPKYWSFSFSISPSNEHPGVCHNSSESPREAQTYIHVLASRQVQLVALDSSLSASVDINQHLTGMD